MVNIKSDYHPQWTINRINFIHKHYPEEYFNGKRVLELAPCRGDIGGHLQSLGADVHLLEGRFDNIYNIRQLYPTVVVEHADLDTPDWIWGDFDIIINFGLYYHLEKYHEQHLINCINHSKLMFFDTVVYDKCEPSIFYRREIGYDQSLSGIGGTPTTSYVENIFDNLNVKYEKYTDRQLNSGLHHYDWEDTCSEIFDEYSRRMWIIEND